MHDITRQARKDDESNDSDDLGSDSVGSLCCISSPVCLFTTALLCPCFIMFFIVCPFLGSAVAAGIVFNRPIQVWTSNSRHLAMPEEYGIWDYEWVKFASLDPLFDRTITIAAVLLHARTLPKDCKKSWMANRSSNLGTTVIAVHGTSSSALSADGYFSILSCSGKALLCAGFDVLALNMRNHGNSSHAAPYSLGYHEANDVIGAAKWLERERDTPRRRVLLWGVSAGGAAVTYAAARDSRFRTLAVISPPASWGLVFKPMVLWLCRGYASPLWLEWYLAFWFKTFSLDSSFDRNLAEQVHRVGADVFHSHSFTDWLVPFSNAEVLQDAFEGRPASLGDSRPPAYKTHFIKGHDHCEPCKHDSYRMLLLAFFSEAGVEAHARNPRLTDNVFEV